MTAEHLPPSVEHEALTRRGSAADVLDNTEMFGDVNKLLGLDRCLRIEQKYQGRMKCERQRRRVVGV